MKASNRFYKFVIVLIGLAIIGCSEQPDQSKEQATSDSEGLSTGKIHSVSILPENPTPEKPLEVYLFMGGDKPERLSFQWIRNGSPVPGAIDRLFPRKSFQKGDFVSVQVHAKWSGGKNETAESETVVIGNSAPYVQSVSFEPAVAGTNDDLKAVVSGSDRDEDRVDFFYAWSVNGDPIGDQDGPVLPSTYYQRDDEVEVAVTPTDGTDFGKTVRGHNKIANTPPEIVSAPPETIMTQGIYTYAVQAQDADGDPIRFSLGGDTPEGMTIDSRTGLVKWQVKLPDEEISYEFEVLAEDSEGETYSQTVTLRLVPQQVEVEVSPAQ
jgi:hypothetical protein